MDSITRATSHLIEAAQHGRSRDLLIREAAREAELAQRKLAENRGQTSMRAAFRAGAEQDWSLAPTWREMRNAIAAEWGITPRHEHTIYLNEPLEKRTLVTTTANAAGYLVEVAHPLAVQEAHDTAGAILGMMTVVTAKNFTGNQLVAKLETLPTTTILSSETSSISDQTPPATQTILAPKHVTSFGNMSRPFVLSTPGGAEAAARLHANAVRSRAVEQILQGTGSNGQLQGLIGNSAVPTAAGTSVDIAKIAAAMESVEKTGSGPFAWVVSASAAKLLRQRAVISGGAAILADNKIAGYPCYVTGCTTNAIAVFGSWVDLQVFQWAPIEIGLDPYGVNSANFQAGLVSVRCWLTLDAAPLLSNSFFTLTSLT